MVILKLLFYRTMHVAELPSVALIKNNDDVLRVNFMHRIFLYENG